MFKLSYFAIFIILAAITVSSAAATTFTDDPITIDQTSGNPLLRLSDSGSKEYDLRIVDGTGRFEIYDNTASQPRITILNDGKVGIGTSTPNTAMDLVNTATDFRLLSTAGNSLFTMNADGGWAAFRLTDKSTQVYDVRMLDNTKRLDVYDKTKNQVRLSITTNGQVGINNINPSEALDVNGNIRLNGNVVSPGDICIGSCS